jgi:pantetheine-phosphate adenylyltransferase
MTIAIYAGTFDILTNGHVWMIEQGSRIFDRLIVAIGENPAKKPQIPLSDRTYMLYRATNRYSVANVNVAHFVAGVYLIDYAKQQGADFILRGIRNQNDYEYEHTMRNINHDLASGITTVFLMPPRELSEISSSLVKGLIGPTGWEQVVARYVPEHVLAWLKQHHG